MFVVTRIATGIATRTVWNLGAPRHESSLSQHSRRSVLLTVTEGGWAMPEVRDEEFDDGEVERTPCPPWCEGFRCHEPFTEDRFHERGETVSVIRRAVIAQPDRSLFIQPDIGEANIVLFTSAVPDAADELWISLDLSEHGSVFCVSLESMKRILRKVEEVMNI